MKRSREQQMREKRGKKKGWKKKPPPPYLPLKTVCASPTSLQSSHFPLMIAFILSCLPPVISQALKSLFFFQAAEEEKERKVELYELRIPPPPPFPDFLPLPHIPSLSLARKYFS
eukprot:TRINITY_DN7286_c1_g1_i1.p1 TRINITY_DN7286_c1_g1~~TRINITY_DN7286_c1_g1_i1.p1  ORF type:complete len:115 (+),score=15.66 TRINITY_DN7286_c1_g1_i1:331-675(+)